MAYVYILHSEKKPNWWYIGQTTLQLQERIQIHAAGRVRSTKPYRPLTLAYFEEVTSRQEAMKREWHLKHPAGYLEKHAILLKVKSDLLSWPLRGPFGPRVPALGAGGRAP
ncbi:MAG: GIY-YIG nuclease family protein [Candidatus Peribacteraceae bacterium]|nr:GIY-YIG nuclease family protein [Candidatus Peribacteraceae bacterium]